MKYVRIKPTIIEAIQCFATPKGIAQIEKFVGNSVKINNKFNPPNIEISAYPAPGNYLCQDAGSDSDATSSFLSVFLSSLQVL